MASPSSSPSFSFFLSFFLLLPPLFVDDVRRVRGRSQRDGERDINERGNASYAAEDAGGNTARTKGVKERGGGPCGRL
jgi:hypothetical protein